MEYIVKCPKCGSDDIHTIDLIDEDYDFSGNHTNTFSACCIKCDYEFKYLEKYEYTGIEILEEEQ